MTPEFCYLDIVVQDRPIYDASGQRVTDRLPAQAGANLFHWASPDLAMAWFHTAHQLCNDAAQVASLDLPINTTDVRANQTQASGQFYYIANILQAIARGYNLLNIVWWNDPPARALYRFYVSGAPTSYGPNTAQAVFSQDENYNDAWYSGANELPGASTQGGDLQKLALRMTGMSGNTNFLTSATLLLEPTGGSYDPNENVESWPSVRNAAMARMLFQQVCPSYTDFPWQNACAMGTLVPPSEASSRWGMGPSNGYAAYMPDGSILPAGFDDWRAAYRGQFYNRAYGGITAPLRSYLPYLCGWVNTLVSRTPYQIIQDARSYAVYENDRSFQGNGGAQAAIQSMMGTDASVFSQQHASSPAANAAASAALALGSVVGAATSGVGALIGGAVATVIRVADVLTPKGVTGHGRDDLGRYKLRFERGWLSGDPSSSDANEGAPTLAPDDFATPPGYSTIPPCPVGPQQAPPSGILPPTTGSDDGMNTVATILLLAAAAGGIGYVAWKFGGASNRKN